MGESSRLVSEGRIPRIGSIFCPGCSVAGWQLFQARGLLCGSAWGGEGEGAGLPVLPAPRAGSLGTAAWLQLGLRPQQQGERCRAWCCGTVLRASCPGALHTCSLRFLLSTDPPQYPWGLGASLQPSPEPVLGVSCCLCPTRAPLLCTKDPRRRNSCSLSPPSPISAWPSQPGSFSSFQSSQSLFFPAWPRQSPRALPRCYQGTAAELPRPQTPPAEPPGRVSSASLGPKEPRCSWPPRSLIRVSL